MIVVKDVCPLVREIFKGKKSEEVFEVGDTVVMKKNVKPYFYNNDIGVIKDKNETHYTIELVEMDEISKLSTEGYIEHDGYKIEKVSDIEMKIPIDTFDSSNNVFIKPNYGRTVHSVQYFQFPLVIFILPVNYGPYVNIKLTYTGYSRAKEKVYLLGKQSAFDNTYAEKENGKDKNSTLDYGIEDLNKISDILNSKGQTRISKSL